MRFSQASLNLASRVLFRDIDWSLEPSQCWTLLGGNASGKSSLARVLAGELTLSSGDIIDCPDTCLWVSLESQQALYERELYRDESDLIDRVDEGTSVAELLEEIAPWSAEHDRLCDTLALSNLRERGYRRLSNGEARRTLLARALLQHPDLLILDEPFEGLDRQSREQLHQVLNQLVEQGQWLLLVLNQTHDIIERCRHVAILDKGQMPYHGKRPEELDALWRQLVADERASLTLPPRQSEFQLPAWPDDRALVEIRSGAVRYDEVFQFRNLDWRLLPGEHSRISGPNGCGKSTLLGLITGDHPQCYNNDLDVLGFHRGSGESIWQIKKHLGYVSGSLHRDYRVAGSALSVVVSGLTDSIGVYSDVGQKEAELAREWLAVIGLADCASRPFRALSSGQQRLLLIARALIKQPPLLILDEPTEGLDDFNRFYVLSLVDRIVAAGDSTLLFVSHRQDERPDCIRRELRFEPATLPDTRYRIVEQ